MLVIQNHYEVLFETFIWKWNEIVSKEVLWSVRDLIKQYKAPSPECYTTFWMMTIYSAILHWSGITPIFDPITDLDLITEFDFLPNCERFP